mmetsp:Transcript_22972/g.22703  ORF Transcript_22972/g.22703 Transcript_22972/m.22703 type:complete len:88 (+) Transcript_22972:447-710(+)
MILATGYDCLDIFALDLLVLSFSSCSVCLLGCQMKLLCNFENSAYLIDFTGKILESDRNGLFNWSIIGNFTGSEGGITGRKALCNKA